jgi:hypothetical protein
MGERHWIILGDDGRHVTVGRHTDPTEQEIARAGDALRATGQGGWLAVTEGDYYSPGRPISVLMVRELATPRQPWESAVAAFQGIRAGALGAPSP